MNIEELERRVGKLVVEYRLGPMQAIVKAMDDMGIPNREIIAYFERKPNVVSNARRLANQKINCKNV